MILQDEFDPRVVSSLRQTMSHPNAQVNQLSRFLEIVKVALPDGWHLVSSVGLSKSWYSPNDSFTHSPTSLFQPQSAADGGRRSRPTSSRSTHSGERSASVAKQFGPFGKKIKKNLGRLARTGSFRDSSASRKLRGKQQQQQQHPCRCSC